MNIETVAMLSITKTCNCYKDSGTFKTLSGLKVLVVDDNLDSLDLLSFILQSYSIEVLTTVSALQALEAIENFVPDILISDLVMPQVDGYWLIRTMRASQSRCQNIPAIAITAAQTEAMLELALRTGFQACLTKPFEEKELINLIMSLCLEPSWKMSA